MSERREAVLRAIVQSTPVATIALDPRGTVHVWNRAAEEMFGWPADDVIGGPAPFALDELVARVTRGDDVAPTRVRFARRDGRALDVELRSAPLRDDAGRMVGAVVACTDVTAERHASEQALEETRAALSRAEELREPAAGVVASADTRLDALELHEAIKRDELTLFYQPIVRLDDAECIGARAEVRWQHPDLGLVAASAILPLAEEHDLSDDLGAWMLERALTQAARWQIEYAGFGVTTSVSARELAHSGLAVLVGALIRREGVPPESVSLEIERRALGDDAVRTTIAELRRVGVRIVLRVSGASGAADALAALAPVTVDAVELDCSLVDESTVMQLKESGMRVVADRVESEAQLSALLRVGCDEARGNFFAPPQPASDLQILVSPSRRWRPPGSHLMRRN